MTPEERAAWDRFMASWSSLKVTAEKLGAAFDGLAAEAAELLKVLRRVGLIEQHDP